MNIFNSLGSDYNFKFALQALSPARKKSQEDLIKYLEEKYQGKAVLFYKGREAFTAALKILNLPQDSVVAICGFTCLSVYESINSAGLKVVYLDLEKGNLNFSPATLQKSLKNNPKIKIVVIQNTLGYPCQIAQIKKICQENHLFLIEDLAHCVGTKYTYGSETGTVGDMTYLSFSQDKMIDGISGGALIIKVQSVKFPGLAPRSGAGKAQSSTINNQLIDLNLSIQIKDRFYPLFTYLIRNLYPLRVGKIIHQVLKIFNLLPKPVEGIGSFKLHQLPGFYCRLIKLGFDNLDNDLKHRREIALTYQKFINPKIISPILEKQINLSSNLRFPIFVDNREDLIKYLKQFGVYVSDIWYDAPIAPKKYLDQTSYQHQCPNSELASAQILNLPTHKNVSVKKAEQIAKLVNQWLKSQ